MQTDSVDKIEVHPSYNNDSHGFDIALLRFIFFYINILIVIFIIIIVLKITNITITKAIIIIAIVMLIITSSKLDTMSQRIDTLPHSG